MEVLQTATRNPARFLGELDNHGTLEQGKAANLVVLNANPLEDIRNTQKIDSVILRGPFLSRAELDKRCREGGKRFTSAGRVCSTRELIAAHQ